ncbi:hypothetical protein FOZ63_021051, partial [Perkinsus olseni]
NGELREGCEVKWRVRWLVVGRSWAVRRASATEDVKKDASLTYECPWSGWGWWSRVLHGLTTVNASWRLVSASGAMRRAPGFLRRLFAAAAALLVPSAFFW